MTTERLGHLEEMVLLAALRLGADAYSVSIIREIRERTGRRLSHGAVFVAIDRLEEKGLVTTRRGDPLDARGGRPRRMVEVTPEAVARLRENRRALLSMWEDLAPLSDR